MTNHKLVNENSKMQPGLFSWDLQGSDNIGQVAFLGWNYICFIVCRTLGFKL